MSFDPNKPCFEVVHKGRKKKKTYSWGMDATAILHMLYDPAEEHEDDFEDIEKIKQEIRNEKGK